MQGGMMDQPVIVFDGQCVLCSASAQFVLRRDRHRRFRVCVAQSDAGRRFYREVGLDPDAMATMIVVADGRVLSNRMRRWRFSNARLAVADRGRRADRAGDAARSGLSLCRAQPLSLVRQARYLLAARPVLHEPLAMTATGMIATAAALAWLAVTLAFQFRPISPWFPVLDRLGLLPRWKFFTQGNGDVDYAIEVRDRHADGSIGAWRPLAVIVSRPRRAFLWFPEKSSQCGVLSRDRHARPPHLRRRRRRAGGVRTPIRRSSLPFAPPPRKHAPAQRASSRWSSCARRRNAR